MRKSLIILSLFLSLFSFAQSNFSNGFSDGYKKGYCQNQGIGCMSPIPPIAPIPKIGENMNSYQDGYNRGFEAGLNAQKSKSDNSTNSTRQRYQTSKAEFIDFTSNSSPSGNEILDLKIKAISAIVERATENLENEDYDAAIDDSNNLLNIQPNLGVAFLIKSNAQFFKGEIINAYNNSAKANNILSNSSSKNWYEFMYKEISEYLSQNMKNSYFSDVQKTCDAFWYKNNLSNYFLGLSHYYQNDFKSAKKAFKKVTDFEPAKKYIESIENNTNLPNPYINFKKAVKEEDESQQTKTTSTNNEEISNKVNTFLENVRKTYENRNYNDAIVLIDKEKNIIPIDFKEGWKYLYNIRGNCNYFQKKYFEAISDYTSSLNNSTKENPNTIYYRALSKSEVKDHYGAIADYEKLIQIGADGKGSVYDLATIYNNKAYALTNLKRYTEALPLVKKALEYNKSYWYIWDTKGEIEFNLGNFNQCILDMTEAIKINKDANSLYYRGLSYLKLGKKELACKDLKSSGEMGKKDAYYEINKYCK